MSFKSCPREGASYWLLLLAADPQCFKSFPREGDAPAGYGAPRGVADPLLVTSGRWVAAGTWDFPLRAKRALKEGVVIRKRQGGTWVPPPLVREAAAQAATVSPLCQNGYRNPAARRYRVGPALLTVSSGNHAHRPVSISPKIEQYSRHRTATHCPG